MQVSSAGATLQSLLSTTSLNDGSRQAPGSVGNSASEDSSQATGVTDSSSSVQSPQQSAQETTVNPEQAAPQTQVVVSADETLGTSLGLNIDTTA